MDLTSGYPYWLVKNGVPATYPTLKQDVVCDVAVIGGGITGALVAYHLVEAGIDTIVLDRRDIGNGSTCASTALLQYEIDTPLSELIEMVGEQHAVRAYQVCLEAITKLERLIAKLDDPLNDACEFVRTPSLYLASRQRDVKPLRREYDTRVKHGFQVDWLSAAQIESTFSFSRPAAIWSKDAAQVDAYRLTHSLLASAAKRGLQIYDRTMIADYKSTAHGVWLTTDRGCRIRAKNVVFATGYESQEYLTQKVTTLKSTYALVSKPLAAFSGWHDQCLIWETARPYLYMRTTADGRAIIGGEDEDFRDPVRRDKLMPKKVQKLVQRFGSMFPAIELEVAYSWCGTFGETKDGLAYIGETPEMPHAYFALGYGGNGITYSLIAAELIRDAYCRQPNPDGKLFRFGR
jgi:glycine/D-amino acid oxidase-like deaminating enzyme